MSNLARIEVNPYYRYSGRTTALCNIPHKIKTWDEVMNRRREKVPMEVALKEFTLFCLKHNRDVSHVLFEDYFKVIVSSMGFEEFLAAIQDLKTAKVLFADFLPYLVEHVKEQRRNGPDPVSMSMKEAGYYD